MKEAFRDPAYRAISIIASIQAFVIIAGTLFVSVMLKLHGYGTNLVPPDFFLKNPIFIRNYGFLFLVIPAIWAFGAVLIVRSHLPARFQLIMLGIGFAMILYELYGYMMLGTIQTKL